MRLVHDDPDEGLRHFEVEDLPISIGGPEADIQIPGTGSGNLAHLGFSEGRFFIQPEATNIELSHNGTPLRASAWLEADDILRAGTGALRLHADGDDLIVRTLSDPRPHRGTPPRIMTPPATGARPSAADPTAAAGAEGVITPVQFQPRRLQATASKRRPRIGRWAMVAIALLVVSWVIWLLFTSVAVTVVVEPPPDSIDISGDFGLPAIGGRILMRPGKHSVMAEKSGYERLDEVFEVVGNGSQTFRFRLEKLGGVLQLITEPADTEVSIDGRPLANWADGVQLTPGQHSIVVSADRYFSDERTIEIAGLGTTTELAITLEPAWAALTFRSVPSGGSLLIDGQLVGTTPITLDVLEGAHRIEVRKAAFKSEQRQIEVRAGNDEELAPIALSPADAVLQVTSEPGGATVLLDGDFAGTTPLQRTVPPGRTLRVEASLAGYSSQPQESRIAAGGKQELHFVLSAELGEIELLVVPADAVLWIDGNIWGPANGTARLPARPHNIEIRKSGYETYRTTIVPTPGYQQALQIILESREEILATRTPQLTTAPQGQKLVLVSPARFTMGASRREPGRRANETLHEVEITRRYYLSAHEITNEQYREFSPSHLVGALGGVNLEGDDRPVVKVSWQEAAEYCNWLSEKEGLPPAYELRNGNLSTVVPLTTGYRLPTEAEWVRAARYPEGGEGRLYPWGDSLPIVSGSGNYADLTAATLIPGSRVDYNDGFAGSSPVGNYPPNPLGVYDLGGNVAEWVHDVYSIHPSSASELVTDPAGPQNGELHTIRGSSWMDFSVSELRWSYRDYGSDPRPDLGFRIARYAD